ncbi:MAG: T9SS type A sorting domain-containing protein, partial [Saprospiraceae bacterium]|nr:T9SS type A sorting domain-containing protein [Saprospiraceae bacterium]
DAGGTILFVSFSPTINFENLPPGNLRVYALSYIGQLLAAPGLNIFTDPLGSICYALTTNFISLNNVSPDGATVFGPNSATSLVICSNDAAPDLISFGSTSTSPLYAYLVTDANNVILQVSTTGNVDFSTLPDGICRVWGFAYVGNITATIGNNAATSNLSSDCFDLSDNFVTVNKATPDGGSVAFDDGSTSLELCTGASAPNLVLNNQTTSPLNYGFVLTDANNIFIRVLSGNSVDFDALPAGAYRVWGLSYSGAIIALAGDNAATATLTDGCYELSGNFVSILKRNLTAGTVSLSNLAFATYTCDNDGIPDELEIISSVTNPEEQYIFVITNELNNIVGTSTDGIIDFEGTGPGICRIWGLAYSGNLTFVPGQPLAQTELSDECYQVSTNFVEVEKKQALGGTVMLENGDDAIDVCAGDGAADALTFITEDGIGEHYNFFLTDEDNTILSVSSDGVIDFESLAAGNYRVWGVAYTGDLNAQEGDNAATVEVSFECYELSANFVEVDVTFVDGGSVSIVGGATSTFVCANDSESDILTFDFSTNALNADYTFIVTDENNRALVVLAGNAVDFNVASPDHICRVWGISFTGTLDIETGDDITATQLTSKCYELSANYVEVRKEETNGGTVAEAEGQDSYFVCPDGIANVLSFSNSGVSTGEYVYVVTNAINTIVAISPDSDIDFDAFAENTYRVWGLAYTGTVTAVVGDNAATTQLTNECFDLSANFIEVVVDTPEGGALSTNDGAFQVYSCPGDSEPDVLAFDNSGASGVGYALLVADETGKVVAIANGTEFDFGTLDEGTYVVYGVAYTGSLTVAIGDDVNAVDLSDECFDLSDTVVTVIHQSPEGGTVALAGGASTIYLCPEGAGSSLLFFESNGAAGPGFTYLITDNQNVIIAFVTGNSINLDALPEGSYRAWSLAYTGDLTAEIGDDAGVAVLSTGCYDLSSNFVEIVNQAPNGGTIAGQGGATTFNLCAGDGDADVIHFNVTGNTAGNYAYLITDENNFLIGVITDDSLDFENVNIDGRVRIHGVAYTGDLVLVPGDPVLLVAASNDCYDLSENFIEVNLTIVDGSVLLSDINGTGTLYICAGDGVADTVSFFSGTLGTVAGYRFVVTNQNNIILAYLPGNQQNYEATAGFDRLRVWGVAFTGTINPVPFGLNITTANLSNGCFDLSDNYIDVIRDLPEGGSVSTGGETDVLLCIGAENGVLNFETTSSSISGYVYLVTTEDNTIVQVSNSEDIDFNELDPGVYHIWGLSYTGVLTASVGQEVTPGANLATSCFELSENFVRVDRAEPVDAGEVSGTSNGETGTLFYTCPDDDNGDLIILENTSLDSNYVYVITDGSGKILIPEILGDVIDFDPAAPGTYRVYGISYNGNPLYGFGTNVTNEPLSDNCYITSSNFITIIVSAPEGGEVLTTEGQPEVTVINGDGEPDVVGVSASGASPTPYTYLVTDENNLIVSIPDGNFFDFESLAAGVYRIWGLAYTGTLTASVGDDAAVAALSDDCFDLSNSFVQVNSEPLTFGSPEDNVEARTEASTPVASSLRLSPNPTKDKLVADLNMGSIERPATTIRIFSATGQLMLQWNEPAVKGANRYSIAVGDLVPGLYLLQATNGGVVQTAKFVKE